MTPPSETQPLVCDRCNGSGMVATGDWGSRPSREVCVKCSGTGTLSESTMVPYGSQGSGDAGNSTSRERRIEEDNAVEEDGRRRGAHRRFVTLHRLEQAEYKGLTCGELENATGWGHGVASSVLSHLHRADLVKRIVDRRMKQEIYVLPQWVSERPLSPYRPRFYANKAEVDEMIRAEKEAAWDEGRQAGHGHMIGKPSTNPYRKDESNDNTDTSRPAEG